MQRRSIALAKLVPLCLLLALFGCYGDDNRVPTGPGPAGSVPTPLPTPTPSEPFAGGTSSVGAQLYDRWWVINGGAAPTTTNPAYPTTEQSGADTWRCKECHGWDYKGVEGAYRTGSHFTGIQGVLEARDNSSEAIGAQIKSGANHDFSEVLSDQDIANLVAFIKEGTIDMNEWIDFGSKKAMGDTANGQTLWSSNCSACHGNDGLGNAADVPALSVDNPWETLHKIRWGHPGTSMPSMVVNGLTTQQQVDILAHAQTL